ncbi:hypothetical protein [Kitasatospora sp. NPDC087314]|uniref:hypothetical protein n=1 Tax=Kitasatospora sp. NPDC087314 TaxID=3364068 RepID=UPI0037F52171
MQDAAKRGVAEKDVPAGCTHLIAAMERLWFTPEEVVQLAALGDAAKAAFDASAEGQRLDARRRGLTEQDRVTAERTVVLCSPEGRALVDERARLADAAAAVLDADDAQRARADEDEDGGDPGDYYRVQRPRNEAAYERARHALAEFDARHPEIIEALTEQRDAAVRRHLELD